MRSLRNASLLSAIALASLAARGDDARAAWPPPPGADLRDPKNWPNDPDYAEAWNYWSWLPPKPPGAAPYLSADLALGASGMSVDRAWTLTTGRDDVTIAVVDSGIEWDERDLVDKVRLSAGELAGAKRPRDASGAACGGQGPLAGYDCNGDGVFSVSDYARDPRLAGTVAGDACFTDGDRTKRGGDRLAGDVNHNCILDAGDLIHLFSDGVDDDGNGYTDDVAGWDFFKNDNDPYDDTRYGHGTGEAKDSSAEGNNGRESIGTCPSCRFVPLRVGDSFIADANDFAKAVVYAADNDVRVVQEALGTVDFTAFARAAIDYAYARRVTVVASMADENSRHHNFPATANHTLPVHAIAYDGDGPSSSTSFLAFNTCTNYGGQLALSVSGKACSSEATGRGAGIAGLVVSMARARANPLDLSAEEVMQILKTTADDVDVPESRNPAFAGRYYESKPGWDQRFGYGRENVFAAVDRVRRGAIPPEVDVVSPEWFAPIFADRAPSVVEIRGRVAAARAAAYDYVVEWAPGVEPDDREFRPLAAPVVNVPPSTIAGVDAPLATFDPRALDTAHVADPDSPHHENDRTVTLRVRATAHYGAAGDARGEARRTIAVVNERNGLDPDLLPGFPLHVGTSIEGGAKLADVDGDRVRDIVLAASDGRLHAWSLKGGALTELPGFPARTRLLDGLDPDATDADLPRYAGAPAYARGRDGGVDPDVAREALVSAPAVADMDGDGAPEIAFSSWSGTVYLIDAAGKAVPGWPKRLPLVPSCPLDPAKPKPAACMDTKHGVARGAFASPVLVDMDRDGRLELVQAAFDGNVYVWHRDGTPLDGWPVALHAPRAAGTSRILTTPAASDFNADGIPDLLSGSNETIAGNDGFGAAFLVDGRGTKTPGGPLFPHWPITMGSFHLFPLVAEGIAASPAAGDFDGDGRPDALLEGNGTPPLLVPADPGEQHGVDDPPRRLPIVRGDDGATRLGLEPTAIFGERSTAARPDTMLPLFSQPTIGDLDQDGTPDPVMSGGSLSLAGNVNGGSSNKPFQHLLAAWSGKTGRMLPGAPMVLEDYTFLTSQAIADVTGDDDPEIVAGSGGYFVHAVDGCGREAPGWPKLTNGWILATPAIGDVDGDGALDVVVGTRDGWLFAWRTRGRADGVVQWESFHHDNANTGDFGRALDQGTVKRAAAPLDCEQPSSPAPPRYDAGGCAAAPRPLAPRPLPARATPAAVAAALALATFARRRRKRPCQPGSL